MDSRSAFGSDVAEPFPDGSIALTCPVSKGWTGQARGSQTRAEHPGTAVRWHGAVYEVVESSALATGGVRYRLAEWQDRHAIRTIESYDAPSEAARGTERVRRTDSVRERRLAILFSPLIGHLPGPVQERLESEIGAPAVAMTVISALPIFVLGILGLLSHIVGVFGAPPFPLAPPLVLSVFFAAESAVRIGSAWIGGHPMGSVAGTLFYRAVLAWRGRKIPAAPADGAPRPGLPDQDLFRLMEPVLSLLPRSDQQRLERRYDFAWRKWGRITAGLLFAVGALNVLASLAAFAGDMAGVGDVVWIFAGTALCVEQGLRWRDLSRGRARGSVLGAAVRPFAWRLQRAPERAVPSPTGPTA